MAGGDLGAAINRPESSLVQVGRKQGLGPCRDVGSRSFVFVGLLAVRTEEVLPIILGQHAVQLIEGTDRRELTAILWDDADPVEKLPQSIVELVPLEALTLAHGVGVVLHKEEWFERL